MTHIQKQFLSALTILLSSFTCIAESSEDNAIVGLDFQHAWIAEAPPVSKVMVAYLTINNRTSKAIELITANSNAYSSIEFHETKHEDGMARMIRHSTLIIPANSSLVLTRGGKHLMLFNPKQRLKDGDTVNIKFTTKNNLEKIVSVIVKKTQH